MERQRKADNDCDTLRNYSSITVGSTVAVEWEDGEPWTHWTIMNKGDHNHNDWSYRV